MLIWIYHRVCIEAYLPATEEKILITITVLLPKEIKGSCQIPSHFWAGSEDFLASNSDFTLFEAVNMWWDFLEISWTLEIFVLLLKYLLCQQALCPQLGGVTVSSHRWLADSAFLPPLHSLQHAKLSKVEVTLWGQQLHSSQLPSLRVFSKNKEVFCWKPVDFSYPVFRRYLHL